MISILVFKHLDVWHVMTRFFFEFWAKIISETICIRIAIGYWCRPLKVTIESANKTYVYIVARKLNHLLVFANVCVCLHFLSPSLSPSLSLFSNNNKYDDHIIFFFAFLSNVSFNHRSSNKHTQWSLSYFQKKMEWKKKKHCNNFGFNFSQYLW